MWHFTATDTDVEGGSFVSLNPPSIGCPVSDSQSHAATAREAEIVHAVTADKDIGKHPKSKVTLLLHISVPAGYPKSSVFANSMDASQGSMNARTFRVEG
jgi:hypothetical protein